LRLTGAPGGPCENTFADCHFDFLSRSDRTNTYAFDSARFLHSNQPFGTADIDIRIPSGEQLRFQGQQLRSGVTESSKQRIDHGEDFYDRN